MSGYVPNPDDVTEPTDAIIAETATAEFRALKAKINNLQGLIQTWNENDTVNGGIISGALLTFTTNLTAGGAIISAGARAILAVVNSKKYWEYTVVQKLGTFSVGVSRLPGSLQQQLGLDTYSAGLDSNGNLWSQAAPIINPGVTFNAGDVIGVYLDTTTKPTGLLTITKNGVTVATTTVDTTSALAWYPAVVVASGTGVYLNNNTVVTANFGGSPFVETLPGGYSSFASSPVAISGIRNVLINCDMSIDQINAGATTTPATGAYFLDGWKYGATQANKFHGAQDLGAVGAPSGYSHYLGTSVIAPVAVAAGDHFDLLQPVEGSQIDHLNFGSVNAKTVTLLFWFYSSLTGVHSGSIVNAALNRSYPFTFINPVASVWTPIAVVIPGDTGGAWLSAVGSASLLVRFNLGCGATFQSANPFSWQAGNFSGVANAISTVATNNATFYISGVELKDGLWTAGTLQERIPTEMKLLRCQRYYNAATVYVGAIAAFVTSFSFPVTMCIVPTVAGGGAGFVLTSAQLQGVWYGQTAGANQNLTFDSRL